MYFRSFPALSLHFVLHLKYVYLLYSIYIYLLVHLVIIALKDQIFIYIQQPSDEAQTMWSVSVSNIETILLVTVINVKFSPARQTTKDLVKGKLD